MRWMLRLIAGWLAFTGLMAGVIAARLAKSLLLHTGLAPTLLLGILGAVAFSGFASVQLWRLRESGRRATLALCLFWGGLWVWLSGPRVSFGGVVWVAFLTLALAAVVQRSARRVCQ